MTDWLQVRVLPGPPYHLMSQSGEMTVYRACPGPAMTLPTPTPVTVCIRCSRASVLTTTAALVAARGSDETKSSFSKYH